MKNYDILMKKGNNTFSFYAGTPQNTLFAIESVFEGLDNLYYQLINNDSNLFNYTDITPVNDNKLYYFQNNIDSGTPQFFQKLEFVSDDDLISFKPKLFNIPLPNTVVTLEIKNSNEPVLTLKIDGSKSNSYQVNLNHLDNGVYELWLNNQIQETFYLSDEQVADNCLGIVSLNIKDIISMYPNNINYAINFNARSVFWQYQVIVQKNRKIQVSEMSVSGISDETYEGPLKQEVIGGQTAEVFTTSIPLKLHNVLENNPQLKVTYSNEFSNRKNELEIKLPNPDVEQLRKYNQGKNEGSFFSSTIIYV
jgi:hypothetical protein